MMEILTLIIKNSNRTDNKDIASDDLQDCLINKNKRHLEIQCLSVN